MAVSPLFASLTAIPRWKVTPSSKLVLSCGVIKAKGDTAYGALVSGSGGVSSSTSLQAATWKEACGTTRRMRCPEAPPSAPRS